MTDNYIIIENTQKWISSVIIEHAICPFAKREYDRKRIHYEVMRTNDIAKQVESLILQCLAMDKDQNVETSLLIFPDDLSDFDDYLDTLDLAVALIEKQGYEGVYQLASFHPQYRFADARIDDPSNYTNRSPYPMIHILREASIEKVLESYPNPESIPDRNIELTSQLGLNKMKQLLANCYK